MSLLDWVQTHILLVIHFIVFIGLGSNPHSTCYTFHCLYWTGFKPTFYLLYISLSLLDWVQTHILLVIHFIVFIGLGSNPHSTCYTFYCLYWTGFKPTFYLLYILLSLLDWVQTHILLVIHFIVFIGLGSNPHSTCYTFHCLYWTGFKPTFYLLYISLSLLDWAQTHILLVIHFIVFIGLGSNPHSTCYTFYCLYLTGLKPTFYLLYILLSLFDWAQTHILLVIHFIVFIGLGSNPHSTCYTFYCLYWTGFKPTFYLLYILLSLLDWVQTHILLVIHFIVFI